MRLTAKQEHFFCLFLTWAALVPSPKVLQIKNDWKSQGNRDSSYICAQLDRWDPLPLLLQSAEV